MIMWRVCGEMCGEIIEDDDEGLNGGCRVIVLGDDGDQASPPLRPLHPIGVLPREQRGRVPHAA